jgi:hypothetical protein
MSTDTVVVKDALRITRILSKHLTAGDCSHCKEVFKEIFD